MKTKRDYSNFKKAEFNTEFDTTNEISQMFTSLGFTPSRVEISYTNGRSAYISLNVNVLNENKMWADVFVYEGKASITVRVSDHSSNLETICGGVAGNKMSFVAFKTLVDNNIIAQA